MRFHLDYETQSHVDLKEVGAYVYANHPSTRITHAAVSVEGGERFLFQLHRDEDLILLHKLADMIQAHADLDRFIVAHNAPFEYLITLFTLSRMLGRKVRVEPRNFDCTMARALVMALPGGLDDCAAAIGVNQKKDKTGKAMMLRHSKPCPYRNAEGKPIYWSELTEDLYVSQELEVFITKLSKRVRQPKDAAAEIEKARQKFIEKFQAFDFDAELDAEGAYCEQDVVVEEEIDKWLPPLSKSEWMTWLLDQKINMAGVPINLDKVALLHGAVKIVLARSGEELAKLTDGEIDKVTQNQRIVKWLNDRGVPCDGTAKDVMEDLILRAQLLGDETAEKVIRLRAAGGQSAVTKLPVMLASSDENCLSRYTLQYCGAATSRWSGRLWQPHNIKRIGEGAVERLDELLTYGTSSEDLVMACDLLDIDLFGAIGDAMRSLLEAPEGLFFVGGDFSNIEGRGNAWLANEEWKIKAFVDFDNGIGFDLYKLAYARAFGLDPATVDKNGRQKGKVMELALGYQGGVGAFQTMAKNYRLFISDSEADLLKIGWREAHPAIKGGWFALENAAIEACQNPGQKQVVFDGKVVYLHDGTHLWCKVPRGGVLCYPFAWVKYVDKWARLKQEHELEADELADTKKILEPVVFFGDRERRRLTKSLYGGLQCENLCQKIARDVLDDKMKAADAAGFDLRLHVHDELQALDKDPGRKSELEVLMREPLAWCPGYPIAAECATDRRYIK